MDKNSHSSVEMNDPASRPAIAERLADMDKYDTVFVGFPIWWYVAPHIINTFLESYSFSGKKLCPLPPPAAAAWAGRSRFCPDADWQSGKMVNGLSDRALADWAARF